MPYIPMDRRYAFADGEADTATTAGELNFLITQEVIYYLQRAGVSYETLNAAIGALECAKQELYRRILTPYEQIKITENGDLGWPSLP